MEDLIWQRAEPVAEVRSEDESTVGLLNLNDDKPRVLSGTAAVIWCLIDGFRLTSQIAEELSQMFEHPKELLLAEVELFIRDLHGLGFLTVVNVPAIDESSTLSPNVRASDG